jgi:hypothetical protein
VTDVSEANKQYNQNLQLQEGPIMTVESTESVKGLCKQQSLKEPKLAELDNVMYTWFTVVWSEGKPVAGPVVTDTAKSFYEAVTADKPTPVGDLAAKFQRTNH